MNSRLIRLSFLAGFIVAVVAGCAHHSAGSPMDSTPLLSMRPDTLPTAAARTIDTIFAPYDRADVPGASVMVLSHGKPVYHRAFGSSELEAHTAATLNTDYRLASLSKAFTAMSIMLLVKDGKLHYDDRLVDVLPGAPAYAREVRISHLLTHTSGLVDYEDFVPDSQTTQLNDDDVLKLMHRTDTLNFAPGSAYHYSNSAYVLLGLIVQRASGMPFPRFLHDRIFAPLHMDSTVAYVKGESTVPQRAYGYTGDSSGHFTRTDQSSTSATLGDGGIYTSVTDMVKWSDALDHATLVDAATMHRAWSPTTLTNGKESGYGYGWFVATVNGELQLRHHGESTGFTNGILKYPRRDLTIIVLTNRTGGVPWDIADRIAALIPN
ncbi:MAG TPA: serine hydrolase domain-containing protein [Gemmatimonadaceae bacterium]|nr:serine hydrolase domain-containing protein [Gemmatimonadaceae bacterium]